MAITPCSTSNPWKHNLNPEASDESGAVSYLESFTLISRLAVAGYRSLRNVVLELDRLTLITGANGSGKTSLYRSLRLLADAAQGRLIASLAEEGGLSSTLWAGPEQFSREMVSGTRPVQGTVRSGPISLRLGFSGEDCGYAIDLGRPEPMHPFQRDPEIKCEAMWTGELLGRANIFAERRGPSVKLRHAETGEWRSVLSNLLPYGHSLCRTFRWARAAPHA
jgi:predicted ATPase